MKRMENGDLQRWEQKRERAFVVRPNVEAPDLAINNNFCHSRPLRPQLRATHPSGSTLAVFRFFLWAQFNQQLEACRGSYSTVDSIIAIRPAALGLILRIPEVSMLPRLINSTLLRERTVQSLVVDGTHLVLVSGNLVFKRLLSFIRYSFNGM